MSVADGDRAGGRIRISIDQRVATVVIDRPARRNALTLSLWRGLEEGLRRLEAREEVDLVVVRGRGGVFAAGADIAEAGEAATDAGAATAYFAQIDAALDALVGLSVPSLALVEGACFGGGLAIALACDLRLLCEDARLAATPARLGLAYPPADVARLVFAVGGATARDLLFTGRVVEAAEALRLGLAQATAPREGFDLAARALIQRVLASDPRSVRAAKAAIGAVERHDREALSAMADQTARFALGPGFAEGRAAFLEKRAPQFSFSGPARYPAGDAFVGASEGAAMKVVYEIVPHDGGWAYRFDGVYSETFPTRQSAAEAARRAAQAQGAPGETTAIQWEDENGVWREALSDGHDRPEAEVRG